MRETSIKAECILVEVVLLEVVVEKEIRFSRDTFKDFLVFFSTDLALGNGGVKTWRN